VASFSIVLSFLGPVSWSYISPCFVMRGTISFSNVLFCWASMVFSWLCRAYSSISLRLMLKRSAMISAVWPMPSPLVWSVRALIRVMMGFRLLSLKERSAFSFCSGVLAL